MTLSKTQHIDHIVMSINEWMRYVIDDTGGADIADALGEFKHEYEMHGITEGEVYRAYCKQYKN